jgi:hypothetical protein
MSSPYLPLMSITVDHAFFAPGPESHFRLLPTARTSKLIDKFGMLLRPSPNGVDLFCQESDRADLLAGVCVEDDMALAFRGFATDSNFSTFTDVGRRVQDETVFVDAAGAKAGADGRRCLHEGEYVSEATLRKNDSPEIAEMLGRNFDPVKPNFFANIQFCDLVNALQETPPGVPAAPQYYLRFAARSSVWKYYFLNDVGSKDIAIVDLDGRTRFSRRGTTALPGQPREAVTFVSEQAITMQKTYTQRFQLREQGEMGERILVKRLPNASVNAIGREMLEGSAVAVLVSEIYIN